MKLKLVALSTLAVASAVALAGGPVAPMHQPTTGVYVQGHLGYDQTGWQSMTTNTLQGITFNYTKNANGGFVFGGDVGYEFSKYFAAEFGGFKFATTKVTVTPPTSAAQTGNLKEYALYGALVMAVPVFTPNVFAFGKFGVGYQNVSVDNTSPFLKSNNHVGPVFAAGLGYSFNMGLALTAQWMRFSGKTDLKGGKFAPNPNVWTGSIGYFFAT